MDDPTPIPDLLITIEVYAETDDAPAKYCIMDSQDCPYWTNDKDDAIKYLTNEI